MPSPNGGEVAACEPAEPGEDFQPANQLGLDGELRQDSVFQGGEEYTIAADAALVVPAGVTLIIEPGARVRFGEGARMVVEGTLLACGRANRRILFTADTATGRPGFWAGIELRQADPDTVIGHATFEFAGRDGHAPLWIEGSDAHLEDVKLDSNQWYAVSFDPNSFPRVRPPFTVENGPQGWEVRGGAFTKNRTWTGAQHFIVNGVVEIGDQATLTIPAGGWVKFLPGSMLRMKGELSAVGSAGQPIVFTSANDAADESAPQPAAGDWVGLQFIGREAQSTLAFVEVRFAGGEAEQRGCLWLSDANPVLRDVSISDCAAFSLSTDIAADPVLDRLSLVEQDAALRWELRESRLDGRVSRSLSKIILADGDTLLVPVLTGWVGVGEQAALTIDPGMILLFKGGERAGFWAEGQLEANGTERDPIVFTSWRDPAAGGEGDPAPGDWAGLRLTNSRPDTVSLSHVALRYGGPAGSDTGCLRLRNASPTVTELEVSDCATYPISSDAASQPAISALALQDNAQANVWEVRESSLEERREWSWESLTAAGGDPVVRLITGRVTIGQQATLTLQPGLVLKFRGGAGLVATGGLLAEGAPEQPIILTSWRDPEGGGTETGAQPGDWAGVLLDGAQAVKQLRFIEIRYAGSADHGASCLTLNGSAPELANVTVSHCAYYPINSDLGSNPSVANLTLIDNAPADEWAVRESRLPRGAQLSWTALAQADGSASIARVATGWLSIEPEARLTLAEGVVLKFARNTGLWVGGAVDAEGASGRPVVLTSWRDPEFSNETGAQAGDWPGLIFEASQGDTQLSHVDIRYAGGERNPRGAIVIAQASPRLADVRVSDSAWYPLSLDLKADPAIERLSLVGNLPANAVEVRGSTLDTPGERVWGAWSDADGRTLARVVTGKLTVGQDSTLRIEPGIVVKFDTNSSLEVLGSLVADDVVLTSIHDDEHGADVDGSGGGERRWPGVKLLGGRVTRLQNTLIRFAEVGLWLENASPQLAGVRIEDSHAGALSADLLSAPNIEGLTLTGNGVNGLVLRVESLPEGETHWALLGAPEDQLVRVLERTLNIGPRSQLLIDSGVVLKFAPESGLVVEGELWAGRVDAVPVIFTALADDSVGGDTNTTSSGPNRGDWHGIAANPNNTDAQLSLFGVEIRYATIGLFLNNLPDWQFDVLTISNSQLFGLSCDAASLFVPDDPRLLLLENGAETLACPTLDREEP
ncbi:MAG: hypothetical protein IT318_04800 [Anaerolineales bacterium]|nr:hypothetical protein [Anaerolineales bacterium]